MVIFDNSNAIIIIIMLQNYYYYMISLRNKHVTRDLKLSNVHKLTINRRKCIFIFAKHIHQRRVVGSSVLC